MRYTSIGDVYRRACKDKAFREGKTSEELSMFDSEVLAETEALIYEVLETSLTHCALEVFRRITARSGDRVLEPSYDDIETFVRHMSFEGLYAIHDMKNYFPYIRSWIYDRMVAERK